MNPTAYGNSHKPVMVEEVITEVGSVVESRDKERLLIADLTLGGGGHSRAIVERLSTEEFELHQFDLDPEALKRYVFESDAIDYDLADSQKLVQHRSNFTAITDVATKVGLFDIALADLGISQNQLDNSDYGLSYRKQAPLDMRYSPELALTAADLIKALSESELTRLLSDYGDVNRASLLANSLKQASPESTDALVQTWLQFLEQNSSLGKGLLAKAKHELAKDPSEIRTYPKEVVRGLAQVFQAFRIAVNVELVNLSELIRTAPDFLSNEGKLLVITFHSGEERVLQKQVFESGLRIAKTLLPTKAEIDTNPRSRSAKLFVLGKTRL